MNTYKYIITTLIVGFGAISLFAQNASEKIFELKSLSTINADNQVVLRWAPNSPEAWEHGNTFGYRIVRYMTKDAQGTELGIEESLATGKMIESQLLPLPESEFEGLLPIDDMYGVVGGAIYGERFDVAPVDTASYSSVFDAVIERQNRYNFCLLACDSDVKVAAAAGLAFIDEEVDYKATYLYRIGLIIAEGSDLETKDTGIEIKVEYDDFNIPPQDIKLTPGDSVMQISWTFDPDMPFTSYVVERSDDNGTSFYEINDKPIISTSPENPSTEIFYLDSLPNNVLSFTYRIKGKNPFGVLSGPSSTASAKGMKAIIEGPLVIEETSAKPDGSNLIIWSFPDEQEQDIVGFKVFRSDLRNGFYEEITQRLLLPGRRGFTDRYPISSAYYRIVAVDIEMREVSSLANLFQVDDITPPVMPSGLEGTATKDGLITLEWTANGEDDLLGYRVYMSNQKEGRYTQVTEERIPENTFYYNVDPNVNAEEIYFRVIALDLRENASEFSTPCTVKRPDIIPPAKPAISTIAATADGIILSVIPSPSEDVVDHVLRRKQAGTNEFIDIHTYSNMNFEPFLDITATENTTYTYRVFAMDDSNNESASEPKNISPINILIVDGVTDLYAEIFYTDKSVFLSWNYPYSDEVYGFDLYRSTDADGYRFYKTIKVEDCFTALINQSAIQNLGEYIYQDNELISKTRIKYKVQVQFKDGRVSELSNPVVLLIQ